jgi:hypothetical protein
MQIAARLFLSALIASVAALFAALLFGSIIPRFSYSLELCNAVVGAVFVTVAWLIAPKLHRKWSGAALILAAAVVLSIFDSPGEPLSCLIGACLAYVLLWFLCR